MSGPAVGIPCVPCLISVGLHVSLLCGNQSYILIDDRIRRKFSKCFRILLFFLSSYLDV